MRRRIELRSLLVTLCVLGAPLARPGLAQDAAESKKIHPPGPWELSRVFPAERIDPGTYPHFYAIFAAQWRPLAADSSGRIALDTALPAAGETPTCAFVRTIASARGGERIRLRFGCAGAASLFYNGKLVQRVPANSAVAPSGDPCALEHETGLELARGLNELLFQVLSGKRGWNLRVVADRPLAAPRKAHDRATRLWESDAVFLTPESVLFDPAREVLYVSSFDNRYQSRSEPSGFISRLKLDGTIEELKWVAGLEAPCGLALRGERLFTVERGKLTEIATADGEILARHPIPRTTFLNDLACDEHGDLYLTDTFRPAGAVAAPIVRWRGGKSERWLQSNRVGRLNGIFAHGAELLIGDTEGGTLSAVTCEDRTLRSIASLGAGVVDGIRVLGKGRYLVSHWEGQLYEVSASGEVTERLDLQPRGMNCADFEYLKEQRVVVIPTFSANKVVAFRLD